MPNSNQKHDDMGLVWIGLILMMGGAAWGFWYFSHAKISYSLLKWSWDLLSLFDYAYAPDFIRSWRAEIAVLAAQPSRITFEQLAKATNTVGYLFVWIPIAITLVAIWIARKHRANFTRRQVTVSTLPWIMSHHSPAIIPSLYYGEAETLLLNIDPPEHRSALSPEEWAAENQLIINGKLDRDKARRLLQEDLGDPISAIDELSSIERALFAVFASRLFGRKVQQDRSLHLLNALNRSCHTHTFNGARGYPDLSVTDSEFGRWKQHEEVREWLVKHPYPRTLLHAMHKAAIDGKGKLPSSYFIWLKGMDRKLWYALNTTGRKGPFIESSAVFTQTLWEDYAADTGYRLTEPFVDDAIDGLEHYLKKIGLVN